MPVVQKTLASREAIEAHFDGAGGLIWTRILLPSLDGDKPGLRIDSDSNSDVWLLFDDGEKPTWIIRDDHTPTGAVKLKPRHATVITQEGRLHGRVRAPGGGMAYEIFVAAPPNMATATSAWAWTLGRGHLRIGRVDAAQVLETGT